jgi:hypothetical protein
MDPAACLNSCRELIRDKEYAECITRLAGYWMWRVRGGFEPKGIEPVNPAHSTINGDALAEHLMMLVADKVAEIE